MLGLYVGSFGGLFGVPWGFLKGKKTLNGGLFVLRVFFGGFFGTKWGKLGSKLGPCWDIWVGYVGFHRVSEGKT